MHPRERDGKTRWRVDNEIGDMREEEGVRQDCSS